MEHVLTVTVKAPSGECLKSIMAAIKPKAKEPFTEKDISTAIHLVCTNAIHAAGFEVVNSSFLSRR